MKLNSHGRPFSEIISPHTGACQSHIMGMFATHNPTAMDSYHVISVMDESRGKRFILERIAIHGGELVLMESAGLGKSHEPMISTFFGEIMNSSNVSCCYFCLLLSSGLQQS